MGAEGRTNSRWLPVAGKEHLLFLRIENVFHRDCPIEDPTMFGSGAIAVGTTSRVGDSKTIERQKQLTFFAGHLSEDAQRSAAWTISPHRNSEPEPANPIQYGEPPPEMCEHGGHERTGEPTIIYPAHRSQTGHAHKRPQGAPVCPLLSFCAVA